MNRLLHIIIDEGYVANPKCNCPCHTGAQLWEYLPCCTPIFTDKDGEWPMKALYKTQYKPKKN